MEGEGFSLCEIVKTLSKKYRKTERSIYYDAEMRGTWQPLFSQLFDLDKARLIVMNRYDLIYRNASFMFKQGEPRNKPQALKIMLDVTKSTVDLLGLTTLQHEADRIHWSDSAEEAKEALRTLTALAR
jgi:hydroxyacyl-ACP dehydratase HTD2-like protein with hotdog domain